ncbi:MAG TPA: hypothetical protein VJ456_00855, partial [Acidimicrobiia bacterium]|nr:hypothetical protein [Acidimicrobiia bacterium]
EGPQGDPLEDDVLDVLESESEPEPELDELDVDVDLTDDEVPPVYAADDVDDDLRDPIDDYDDLTAAEILPQLKALDAAELQWVWDRESSGGNRPAILAQVERLMVSSGGTSPAPARRAPATRPATKKAATKKAATKKAAPKKAAPKKALKKTAAKSRTAKKTPAKKTARSRRA